MANCISTIVIFRFLVAASKLHKEEHTSLEEV
jgi:hypothetical protein